MAITRQWQQLGILAALTCAAGVATAQAPQTYPNRQITMIIGFAAGSTTDSIGRVLAPYMSEKLKTPIIVDNKPGGGTVISVQALMKSPKDGYTLMLGAASTLVQSPGVQKDLPYDTLRDMVPIVGVARMPGIMAVRNGFPVASVRDLVPYLKKNPGKVTYGSSGIGAAGHLTGELFLYRTGTDMIHVPYKGANQVSADLAADRLDLAITTAAASLPLIRQGKLKGLAVTTLTRLPSAPTIPTLVESGLTGMEGMDPYTFYGLMAPQGTPQGPVMRVNQVVNEILKDAEFVKKLTALEFDPDQPNTPAEFTKFLSMHLSIWRELGARLNITAN